MNNKNNNEAPYISDDSSWNNLFEMAEMYGSSDSHDSYDSHGSYDSYEVSEYYEENESYKALDENIDANYNTPEEALKILFGYDSFRTGQRSIIDNILAGRDTFAVMPTGAGKSVCYQIPAMMLPGITLVISPLISLMQDQVKALNEAGVSAAFINSSLSDKAFSQIVNNAGRGRYKIIYAAPERLVTDSFLELTKNVLISMITVDEAHCISQWGQDFRPSYMRIVDFVKMLDKRPIISAFTATATATVREDIVCTLGLLNPYSLITGFDRANLFFQVDKPKNKDKYILDYIAEHSNDSGIIYCATRKNVDNLYDLLKSRGISVGKYHAGLGAAERKKMQNDFVFDYTSIVVATNAFGMGIDKSNVRFVIHYNMPQSMENYYQEAGRAGRDGLDSKCILLFSPQDIIINRFLIEHKENAEIASEDMMTVRDRDTKRLQIMEGYCYTTECLRNYILKYFGENPAKPCEDCGNCLHEFETLDMTEAAKHIINCVFEAKSRYGRSIIIDTVIGAKTARLEEVGAVNYKSYGILASANKHLLKRLVEQMILEGYLISGNYQVLKIGDISRLKNPETVVLVKITDDDKLQQKEPGLIKKSKRMESLTSAGFKLFERFRELRLDIAREENVPPYIIFNDKTLIEMAAKVPLTKSEMLAVSGVGENKYCKYGERFIAVIKACIDDNPELIKNKTETDEFDVLKQQAYPTRKKKKIAKEEFNLLRKEADEFQYTDLNNIYAIRDEMNRICVRDNVKRIPATKLTEYLIELGLIVEQEREGIYVKSPTENGIRRGIEAKIKVSERGNEYFYLTYPADVQKMLVEHYISENDDYEC